MIFEIGGHYTARPEFTRAGVGPDKGCPTTRPMRGMCVSVTPRLVTLAFRFPRGVIRESFRHGDVMK